MSIRRPQSTAPKYITSVQYSQLKTLIDSMNEEISGHAKKMADRVQYQVGHINQIFAIIRDQQEAREVKYLEEMEGIQGFKREMVRLVGVAVENSQQKEGEMIEYVRREVEKSEKLMRKVEKEHEDEVQGVSDSVGRRINESFQKLERMKRENEAGIEMIKEVARQRIKESEEKIRRLKESHEANSQQLIDRLMEVYNTFHRQVLSQKQKRTKQKQQFLDLVDLSIQKIKQLYEQ